MFQWGPVDGVFSFGQNSYGELGHGDSVDRSTPVRVAWDEDVEIVDIACGNEHTTLLDDKGNVYTCGYNDSGQCGTESNKDHQMRLTRVASLSNKKIAHVYSGNGSEHVAALTELGQLYMFGFNSRGQLGLGTAVASVPTPTSVPALSGKRVIDVASSYFHTAIVTVDGELYTCGRNDLGQLGTGDTVDRLEPTLVSSLREHLVRAVSCGQHHTVIVIGSGEVYACGKNDIGQLGFGQTSGPVLLPKLVTGALGGEVVTTLACGYYHTLAVTESGSVYAFGKNDYGQLGLGHKRHVNTPTMVGSLERVRIVGAACGCYHSLLLSDEGKVYPFGRNNHGQLGLDSVVDCVSPQIIPSLRDQHVRKVAAGFYHSLCLIGSPTSSSGDAPKGRTTLSSDMRRMLNNPVRSDVTFVVEGVPLYAHSCLLMARCEPLEKMLDGRTKDSSLSTIDIPECSHEVFAALLEFLYTDEVSALRNPNVDTDFVLELMQVADQYLVQALKSDCEAVLVASMSIANVCVLYQAAHFRESFKMKRKCLSYMLDRFSDVISSPAFIELPPTLLQEVLLTAARNGVAIPNQRRSVTHIASEEDDDTMGVPRH